MRQAARRASIAALTACLLSLVITARSSIAMAAATSSPARADADSLQRALEEVDQTLPGPNWSEYGNELVATLMSWILSPLGYVFGGSATLVQALAWLLLATIVSILAVWLVRWAIQTLRASRAAARSSTETIIEGDAAPLALDAGTWRDEIDRRLTGGRIEAALEAVWWWMASSLVRDEVDPAWTSRELLVAAHRQDLGPLANDLDRMTYGVGRPSRSELMRLVTRLESTLA